MKSEWTSMKAIDFMDFNPREKMPKGTPAKKVAMAHLHPFTRDIGAFEVAPYKGGAKFRNGDTLMARITPCLENGKTALVNFLGEGEIGFGSTEFIVLRAKPGISDKDFVYYLSLSPPFRDRAIKSMVGSSGRQRVQRDVMENTRLLVPPLREQIKIGRTLGALDDKIKNNTKINRHLEQMAQTIFKSWFVDFEPWGGRKPEQWLTSTVGDISTKIICGKTPPTKVKEYFGNDIPFVTIPDLRSGVYITSTQRLLSNSGAATQISKTVPANSICVSCIATPGLVALTSTPSQTNQQINTIICKQNISPFYVYLTMANLSEHITMLGSSGSTTNNLNKGQFAKIEVLIPEQNTLNEFSFLVKPLFKQIKYNQLQSKHIAALRDTLLPRLISGEISVADLDAV